MRGLDLTYFVRRIGMFFLVVFVAATFNFFIPRLAPGNPIGAITSRMANASSGIENGKILSSDPVLPDDNLGSEPATPPAVSPKPSRIVKHVKSPIHTELRKAHSDTQDSTQLQTLAASTQHENLMPAGTPISAPQEPPTISSSPNIVPEPSVEPTNIVSQPKSGGNQTKEHKLYVEVGSFKDETWANNAVDKLTQLGFHAVLIHKNLLWSQSYHVEVGPYSDQKDIAEARKSLAAQGFKTHP